MPSLRGQRRISRPGSADFVVRRDMRGQRRATSSGVRDLVVDREHQIAQLAGRQDGVAGRAQLREIGLSGDTIDRRVAAGSLIVLFRGVYAVGHGAVSPRGWARAALLAVGPDAVLSHRTAAHIWGLTDPPPTVHVSIPGRRLRPRTGLTPHTLTHPYLPNEVRHRDGLRLTSPIRTLHDLRHDPDLEALASAAQIRRLITRHEAARLIGDPAPTRSEFERAMRRLVAAAGLPRPLVNHHVEGRERDFVWPRERVVVETDGWGTHSARTAFEDDRDRDSALVAGGWVVIRVTWRQLTTQPLLVATRLARTLALRGAGPPG